MNNFHAKTPQQIMDSLKVDYKGLHDAKVKIQRDIYGFNELDEAAAKSAFQIFFEQFKDFLVLILLAAATISAFLGEIESTLVILAVVAINAILGTIQHRKAEQSLKSLKALSSPTAKVLRNNKKMEIPSRELVVGDICYLDAGDYISADGRILESYNVQVNESSLTGESESVIKTIDVIDQEEIAIGDRKNMVFSGSFVTYGRAVILITSIGMNTEIGKIAHLLESAKEKKTPLQESLDNFGKKLALLILILSAFVFSLDVFRGNDIMNAFLFAVSLAVAAIPEALSSIVTIVLALGTQKMTKANAIIRKLQAVESLGSISVICSDKTGTLTQNKMTVQKLYIDNKVTELNQLNPEHDLEKNLVLMSLLCNDAVTIEKKEIGDPTEIALVNLGDLYHLDELLARNRYPRVAELPFDSERKLMSTLNTWDGNPLMITKGALDVLLARSVNLQTSDGVQPLTEEHKQSIEAMNCEFSQNGLRVLAFACKELPFNRELVVEDENGLTFVGLIAMMDPPRAESAQAVADCLRAGIKPVMITGDHKITASAIAKQIGILTDDAQAIEGYELERMSDEVLKQRVEEISVYARVSPEHKIRIVRAWQEKGKVVAMTGDGVNDAPALKQADIGIAMGITGTEVAKDAAAMVLTDDNFSTIVRAISNGRSIYANIKNAIQFLLSGNTAGILSVMYASLLALPNPFAPVHLLFINLVTDSLPAIAIGLEPHNETVMKERPRDRNTPILDKRFGLEVLLEGLLIAIGTMLAYYVGLSAGGAETARTMAFATLCLSRLLHGFNCRGKDSLFRLGVFSNKFIWLAVAVGLLMLISVLTFQPLMVLFEIAPLTGMQYAVIFGVSLLPLLLVQIYKLFASRK